MISDILRISADRTGTCSSAESSVSSKRPGTSHRWKKSSSRTASTATSRSARRGTNLAAIHEGLKPPRKLLREVTDEDVTRLTEPHQAHFEFDSFKADERIAALEGDIDKKHHLDNLTEYAIDWFKNSKTSTARAASAKRMARSTPSTARWPWQCQVYWNPEEGFVGTASSAARELLGDCSDIDDIIVFRRDGDAGEQSVGKAFGKDLLYAAVWKKGDKRATYNVVTSTAPQDGAC